MESSDIRAYIKRWQAVDDIERQELQSDSLADNWRRLNSIKQRAVRLDIKRKNDDGEMAIFLLWAGLKANHVPN